MAIHLVFERPLAPLASSSQRDFGRRDLGGERSLRVFGAKTVALSCDNAASLRERTDLNSDRSPSEAVAAGFVWTSGTELAAHCQQETSR